MNRVAAICAAATLVSFLACSGGNGPSNGPTPAAPSGVSHQPTISAPPALFVGAGDIADCRSNGAEQTARLLDRFGGTVFTTGDNAYPDGTVRDYERCYGPTWGRHRGRTRPAPGNHEYHSAGASAYFQYFGGNAGPSGRGYYSFDLGAWHIISLNSEIDMRAGSAQEQWLRHDLATNPRPCTAAYWHKPLFSSGPHGGFAPARSLWQTLYEHDVEIVLTGHDHLYERFAPQDAEGSPDPVRGIRQFTLGTGGAERYEGHNTRPNSEIRGRDWGVLALTLESSSYRWEFVPVEGATFRDAGTSSCH